MRKRILQPNSRVHRKAGFSLTEVVMVVGIVGILGSTGFISVARKMPEMKDEKATSDLISRVRQCRLEAITRDMPVEWWLSGTQLMYWIDSDEDGDKDTGEVESLDLDDRGRYSTYPALGKFDSRGEIVPTSSYPGVLLWSYQKTRVDLLTVSANGHIRKHNAY